MYHVRELLFLDAVTTSVFGGGSGPIHYINAFCSGNENHLLNCIVSDAIHCSHEDDVGVRCPTGEWLAIATCIYVCYIYHGLIVDKSPLQFV